MGRWQGEEEEGEKPGAVGETLRLREERAQGHPSHGQVHRAHRSEAAAPAPAPAASPSADNASLVCFIYPFGIDLHAGRQTPCTERPGWLPPTVWAEPQHLGPASTIVCWVQTPPKGAGASRPAPAVADLGGCCREEPQHTERCSCSFRGQSGVTSDGQSGGAVGTFLLTWARKCSCTSRIYDMIHSWTNVGFSSVQGLSVWSLSSPPTTATLGGLTGPETRAIEARGSWALQVPAQADVARAPVTWTFHRVAVAGR